MFSVVPSHNSHSSGLLLLSSTQHKNRTQGMKRPAHSTDGKVETTDTAPSHWDLQPPRLHLKYPQGSLAEWPWSPLEGCRLGTVILPLWEEDTRLWLARLWLGRILTG